MMMSGIGWSCTLIDCTESVSLSSDLSLEQEESIKMQLDEHSSANLLMTSVLKMFAAISEEEQVVQTSQMLFCSKSAFTQLDCPKQFALITIKNKIPIAPDTFFK